MATGTGPSGTVSCDWPCRHASFSNHSLQGGAAIGPREGPERRYEGNNNSRRRLKSEQMTSCICLVRTGRWKGCFSRPLYARACPHSRELESNALQPNRGNSWHTFSESRTLRPLYHPSQIALTLTHPGDTLLTFPSHRISLTHSTLQSL